MMSVVAAVVVVVVVVAVVVATSLSSIVRCTWRKSDRNWISHPP